MQHLPQPDDCRDDPRLDTTAWRVFGRRFPRRFSLYFRLAAIAVLILGLGWWFTRDVTYVKNVKVSGLESIAESQREPLRSLAEDFAALVNDLADRGYGWQSGALPALRTGEALSEEESARYWALASLEVKNAGLEKGEAGKALVRRLQERGWSWGAGLLPGMARTEGPLQAIMSVEELPGGREQLRMEIILR